MADITVNLDNLKDSEREQLLALIEKANAPQSNLWKPKIGEKYYVVTGLGRIEDYTWNDSGSDNRGYNIGNCLRTVEEAEFEVERRKVLHELRVLANGFNRNTARKWYALFYRTTDNVVKVSDYYSTVVGNGIYFGSKEDAQKAIDTIGVTRLKKYYFGIE